MKTTLAEAWDIYEKRTAAKGIDSKHINTMKMIFYAGAAGVLTLEGLEDPIVREAIEAEIFKFFNGLMMKDRFPFN